MPDFLGRRGDDPPESERPGAGNTGAVLVKADTHEHTREQRKAQPKRAKLAFDVVLQNEAGEHVVRVEGRVAWMLQRLIEAGPEGFTAADAPAGTRVSHYVFRLRQEGITVETEHEGHGGQFAGRHARYRLGCRVAIREPNAVSGRAA